MARVDSAGSLLREARQRAALTQVQLGQRAGVAQSVVSAYESGRRQPSLPTLMSLLAATGHTLDASLVATSDPSPMNAVMPADTRAAAGTLSSKNPSVLDAQIASPTADPGRGSHTTATGPGALRRPSWTSARGEPTRRR